MYFMIYKTTNLVNGKYYIGKHQTHNLDDGYLGSGKLLKSAIKKYGFSNFRRDVLFMCDSRSHMNLKESELITQSVVDDVMSYNLKLGGEGGFDYHNSDSEKQRQKNLLSQAAQRILMGDPAYREARGKKISEGLKNSAAAKKAAAARKGIPTGRATMRGRVHTKETKNLMSLKATLNNSQKGSFWVTDGVVNLKIRPGNAIPTGFVKGRKK